MMTPRRRVFAATAIVLTVLVSSTGSQLAAQASATPNADEQAVLRMNTQFDVAILAADTAFFRQVLAPEYLFITATGAVRSRDEVLRYYAAREIAWRVYRADSVRVRLFGDAAVVTAVVVREGGWVAGPRAGTDLSGRYRSTRVYVRRHRRWQLASTHESPLAS